jgi:Glycosyltransferases involved in cell wall biogenesis
MLEPINPLVSVIICAYNGEKYLRRCLKSVLCQSYQSLEIIFVDDGSTDCTPAIIAEYAKSDSRIFIIQKANEGTAVARRFGVNQAKGKYIQYLDCDDVLMDNAIECLVDRAEETQADVVVAPFLFCENGEKRESDIIEFEQMSGIEYLSHILYSRAYWAMWTKFHLHSLYIEDAEKLNISFGEDVVLSTQILSRSKKIVSISIPILEYNIYPSSVSHNMSEEAYNDFNIYAVWFDNYIESIGMKERLEKELALFHIKNTQKRMQWKKVKDANKEMKRMQMELRNYPELQQLLLRREKKIVTTYNISGLLGYWRLCYYSWRNKL